MPSATAQSTWDARIARARELASIRPAARDLLLFYATLAEYQRGLAVFTRRYFQQLYERLRTPFAIVFDGCHDVPAFSPFHEVLREALAQQHMVETVA